MATSAEEAFAHFKGGTKFPWRHRLKKPLCKLKKGTKVPRRHRQEREERKEREVREERDVREERGERRSRFNFREVIKEVSTARNRELVRQTPVIEARVVEMVRMVPATLMQVSQIKPRANRVDRHFMLEQVERWRITVPFLICPNDLDASSTSQDFKGELISALDRVRGSDSIPVPAFVPHPADIA